MVMSKETRVIVAAEVPESVRDALRKIAHKNNRTVGKHAAWVLERHVRAQEDDGA